MSLSNGVRKFLLEAPDPSVRYFTLRDLMDRRDDDGEVASAWSEIGTKGWAAEILKQQQSGGHWETFQGDGDDLYVPKYIATNWRLLVLGDLGMTVADRRVGAATNLLRKHWAGKDGVLGGKGSEVCITGNSARLFHQLGLADLPETSDSLEWLVGEQKPDGGWHCFPSETGTLDAWEALAAFAQVPKAKRSAAVDRAVARGAEFFLERGLLTDPDGARYEPWHRLHYPRHYYYDLLVGLELLTSLGYGDDPRLKAPLDELQSKRTPEGTWRLDALHPDVPPDDPYGSSRVHPYYPFGLEAVDRPSRWITLEALRVLRRAGRA